MLLGNSTRVPGPYVHVHLMMVEAREIWSGINAPTFPLCFARGLWPPVLRLAIGEILYFSAVALLWYWVGRYFDQWNRADGPSTPRTKRGRKSIYRVLLVGWGVFLLFWNIWTLDDAFPVLFLGGRLFRPGVVIVRTLFLLWSAILIVFPGLSLAQDLRRKRSS